MSQHDHSKPFERRGAERIYNPFPAIVEGTEENGDPFKIATVLDNLSREGLYLRMVPCVDIGSSLSVVFRLSGSVASEQEGARVAIRGEVLRVDRKEGGACGVALRFKPAKFVWEDGSCLRRAHAI